MSAVEEIQAAIDKLTELKAESTPGPWSWEEPSTDPWPQNDRSLVGAALPGSNYPELVLSGWGYDASGIDGSDMDRELIVTLHRTIDAQMTILTDFMERYSMRRDTDWEPIAPSARNALNLARAINGGTQ